MTEEISIRKKRKLLESLDKKELKTIKVAIKRHYIRPTNKPIRPLIRELGEPALLQVHFVTDGKREGQPIFERDDIIVNNDEETDELSQPKPGPQSECKGQTIASSSENKKSNRDYKPVEPNFPEPPEADECNQSRPDKYRYSPHRKHSRSSSYEKRTSHDSRYKSVNYKHRCCSPESKRYSSRSVSSSPERYRRNSPRRNKKYHEKVYRRSITPQPSCSRTRRSRSASPSSSKRRLHSRSREYKNERKPSRSPPLRPGEYRPRRSRSLSLRRKSKSRSRTPSRRTRPGEYIPKKRPGEYIPRKKFRSPELRPSERVVRRSRSRTPSRSHSPRLKPGEYRPRKRSKSPPLRPGEYRPSKHKEWDRNFEAHSNPYDYSFYNEIDYGSIIRPPFLPRFPPRPILRHGQILVPHVQFVPYPACPPVRAPFIRPPKIYNNRQIPKFNAIEEAPANSNTGQSNTATGEKEETEKPDSPEKKNL